MLVKRKLLLQALVFILAVFATRLAVTTLGPVQSETRKPTAAETVADGLAAWQDVYSVLISPRCINCHTATEYPQQGDDRHRHFANVIRGRGGRGVPGLVCMSCHQDANADSTGVPGGPGWHLAPLSMKWQDTNDRPLSSADVCRAVTDRSKNENMDGRALLKHHEEAALVVWAWNPGRRPDGTMRTTPPLTHAQFVAATRTWVEAGTPCPPAR